MQREGIINKYKELFTEEPRLFVAPGRINLIGEHTDYNDGYVLPAAIDKAIVFAVAPNGEESKCNLYANDLSESFSFDLNDFAPVPGSWANYIMGVCDQIQKKGKAIKGFNMVFGGDIPLGAGLSSSAALESGTAVALNALYDYGFERLEMVKMAQMAEHTYAGVKCGIMDQFASVMGKENGVIRLDCRSLEYEYFPLELGDYTIVLCDTQVKHSLASSEYNTRRQECESGLEILKGINPEITSFRDVSMDFLLANEAAFEANVFQRLRYVVGEIYRVEAACERLNENDLTAFGKLMYETHDGLSKDYAVSCKELDFLVDQTRDDAEVIGARMMGGGFGGCTINIVKESYADAFIAKMTQAYKSDLDLDLKTYRVDVKEGVHEETVTV